MLCLTFQIFIGLLSTFDFWLRSNWILDYYFGKSQIL